MNIYIIGLLAMLLLAALVGWFLAARKEAEKPVKVMLFVLYFWVIVFVEIALSGLVYFLLDKLT